MVRALGEIASLGLQSPKEAKARFWLLCFPWTLEPRIVIASPKMPGKELQHCGDAVGESGVKAQLWLAWL